MNLKYIFNSYLHSLKYMPAFEKVFQQLSYLNVAHSICILALPRFYLQFLPCAANILKYLRCVCITK